MNRVVSLCWNWTDTFGTCVPARPLPRASDAYHRTTWTKWHLIDAALVVARAALFLDADCMLLANPFSAPGIEHWLREGKRGSALRPSPPQLWYQFEGPGSNPLNSGQLLTSSRVAVLAVLADEPRTFEGVTLLEQEIAHAALVRRGVSIERLPAPFAGNCWFGPAEVPWCKLVAFHAHCTGSLGEKLERLRLVLRETHACDREDTASGVLALGRSTLQSSSRENLKTVRNGRQMDMEMPLDTDMQLELQRTVRTANVGRRRFISRHS